MVYDRALLEKNAKIEEEKIASGMYTRTQMLDRIRREIFILEGNKKKNKRILSYLREEYRALAEEEFAK